MEFRGRDITQFHFIIFSAYFTPSPSFSYNLFLWLIAQNGGGEAKIEVNGTTTVYFY